MKRNIIAEDDKENQQNLGPNSKKFQTRCGTSGQTIENGRSGSGAYQSSHHFSAVDVERDLSPEAHQTLDQHGEETESGQDEYMIDAATPTKSFSKHQITSITPKIISFETRLFSTPTKLNGNSDSHIALTIDKNINRSARRKSTRSLIERTIRGDYSDTEENEFLAEQICNSEDYNHEDDEEKVTHAKGLSSKTIQKERMERPRERRRAQTSIHGLAAHENFFYQNKVGHSKTSNNTLASLELLDHKEYFGFSHRLKDLHENSLKNLEKVHSDKFNRWQFELSQNFNLCLYGFGSKRSLLLKFADHIYNTQRNQRRSKIVVVNGYVKNLTIRDVLKTITSAITKDLLKPGSLADMLETAFDLLSQDKSWDITLIINSIDGIPLRRPACQYILSRLCSHSQIHLVASADHLSFPLLWDSSLRSIYNFIFHDCTTFQMYSAEIDVVNEVHELFGQSGRRVGGREGVRFVLKSLPENAKKLFRLLIEEQLLSIDEVGAGSEDDLADESKNQAVKFKKDDRGIGYRILYQKAVEAFICSNEMNFRTLLKEFCDHQMIQSKKDALGTEILSVPFRKEELESILEDIKAL